MELGSEALVGKGSRGKGGDRRDRRGQFLDERRQARN